MSSPSPRRLRCVRLMRTQIAEMIPETKWNGWKRGATTVRSTLIYTGSSKPMFIDEARIRVKAGDGGNGCMAFRREKFVPRGGPSGGDGGHGGDILMESSLSHNTLIHFRFNPEHKAQRGGHGLGSNCSGYSGEHLTLKVPVGTILYDDESGEVVHDFDRPDEFDCDCSRRSWGPRQPAFRNLDSPGTARA